MWASLGHHCSVYHNLNGKHTETVTLRLGPPAKVEFCWRPVGWDVWNHHITIPRCPKDGTSLIDLEDVFLLEWRDRKKWGGIFKRHVEASKNAIVITAIINIYWSSVIPETVLGTLRTLFPWICSMGQKSKHGCLCFRDKEIELHKYSGLFVQLSF